MGPIQCVCERVCEHCVPSPQTDPVTGPPYGRTSENAIVLGVNSAGSAHAKGSVTITEDKKQKARNVKTCVITRVSVITWVSYITSVSVIARDSIWFSVITSVRSRERVVGGGS